jgi:cytochrome c oxidase subunit 6b
MSDASEAVAQKVQSVVEDYFPNHLDSSKTKLKAIIRWYTQQIYKEFGRETPIKKNEVEAIYALAKGTDTKALQYDPRFPNQNQASNCWTAFQEYNLCVDKRGYDDLLCRQRGRDYTSLCPENWIAGWKEQAAKGTLPGIGTHFIEDRWEAAKNKESE